MGISFSVRVKAHVPKPIRKKKQARNRRTDGQMDRQTDGQDRYMMGPPSGKDGPIIKDLTPKGLGGFLIFQTLVVEPVGGQTTDFLTHGYCIHATQ